MRKTSGVAITIAAVIAIAGVTSILIRHNGNTGKGRQNRAQVVTPQIPDATIIKSIQDANVRVEGLSATNVGGIVVLKGTADTVAAMQAAAVVKQLGFTRVANLIVTRPAADDEGIRRVAERQLASIRALDDCNLRVSCAKGILRVEGTASNDLQADVARSVLRGVGAQEVRVELKRL